MKIPGEICFVGGKAYMYVNKQGTIEYLSHVKWWRILMLLVWQKFGKKLKPVEVREYLRSSLY